MEHAGAGRAGAVSYNAGVEMDDQTSDLSGRLTPQPREPAPMALLAFVLGLAAIGCIVATRLCWSDIPLQTDTGMWAYIGDRILDGRLLYVDLWESKPPGIYHAFAAIEAVFGRGGDRALLWMDALLSLGILAMTYATARRFSSRAASAFAVLVLSVVLTHRVLADWGLNVEKFVALFEMAACYCVVRHMSLVVGESERTSGRAWWLAAGVLCGLAAMFKQTGLAFLLAATFGTIVVRLANRDLRTQLAGALRRLWLGVAIVWVPLIVWMLHRGIFDGFVEQAVLYDLFRAGSGELERHRILSGEHWSAAWTHLKLVGVLFGPALVAYLWWATPFFRSASLALRPQRRSLDAVMFTVGAYWELTTLIFLIAPYGYGHYLLQAAPPAAIILAWMVSRWTESSQARFWRAIALAVFALGLLPLRDQLQFTFNRAYPYRHAYDVQRTRMDAMLAVLHEHTSAGQAVMLWPPDAAVSYYARRRTPLEGSNADVIFKGKINRLRPPMSELLERLKADPPEVLVDWTPVSVGREPDGEPFLGVPAAGFSLLDDPDDAYAWEEGRQLAPLKRWIRATYGGQRRVDPCVLYYRGEAWREWREVLLPDDR